ASASIRRGRARRITRSGYAGEGSGPLYRNGTPSRLHSARSEHFVSSAHARSPRERGLSQRLSRRQIALSRERATSLIAFGSSFRTISRYGRCVVPIEFVGDAGHNVQYDRPDAVVAAILEVVSEVRSDPPSRAPDASVH